MTGLAIITLIVQFMLRWTLGKSVANAKGEYNLKTDYHIQRRIQHMFTGCLLICFDFFILDVYIKCYSLILSYLFLLVVHKLRTEYSPKFNKFFLS